MRSRMQRRRQKQETSFEDLGYPNRPYPAAGNLALCIPLFRGGFSLAESGVDC